MLASSRPVVVALFGALFAVAACSSEGGETNPGADVGVADLGVSDLGEGGDGPAPAVDTAQPPADTITPSGPAYKAVSAGGSHTCAIDTGDRLWCWGSNTNGQLGDGTGGSTSRALPKRVKGLATVAWVDADWVHTCAATTDGVAFCWGENDGMQLGDPQAEQTKSFCVQGGCKEPVQVVELIGVRAVGTGARHSCAIYGNDSAVACWGFNELGQLGDGRKPTDSAKPSKVGGLTGVEQVSGSAWHTCAVTSGGKAYCWGDNADGNLGVSEPDEAGSPIEVPGVTGVVAVSAGDTHSCVLTGAGKVLCFGDNSAGQLGSDGTTGTETPTEVAGISGVRSVSTTLNHTCAVDGAGAVWCWGSNGADDNGDGVPETTNGKLGQPAAIKNSRLPVKIVGIGAPAVAVTTGDEHSCALTQAGEVYCWGLNDEGQLGVDASATGTSPTPVKVPMPTE